MGISEMVAGKKIEMFQKCASPSCRSSYSLKEMVFQCKKCGGPLEYEFKGNYNGMLHERTDLWKNFPLIALEYERNIMSLNAGGSEVIHLEELSKYLNGANLFFMCDNEKNPTGTFKDREASVILSRCKEIGLDNLVFYSTANTGRAYTHYAAHLGLTTYMFMPKQCHYKNTDFIKKNRNNFIIYVDGYYPQISPYTKLFAKANGLNPIAPMHDRIEAYATVAYEQLEVLPDCDYFVQTIASGMGPIGFYKGHLNLINLGMQTREKIPRIVCIQSSEMNVMSTAYNSGHKELWPEDLPAKFADDLFEPTLNSTNPVNNYPQLMRTLDENRGMITDVDEKAALCDGASIVCALDRRGIKIRTDLEKSILIGYAGIVKLAKKGNFARGENILLLGSGRGKDGSHRLIEPDTVINPCNRDPVKLYENLQARL
jgi:threonine synthase